MKVKILKQNKQTVLTFQNPAKKVRIFKRGQAVWITDKTGKNLIRKRMARRLK